MERHTVFVFLLLAIIPVIISAKQKVEEADLRDIVNKQNGLLIEYNKNLDQAVPFKELRASLVALDGLAKDYNGECRDDIYNATTMGYRATDNYYSATDKIFGWCSSTKRLTTYSLNNNASKTQVFEAMIASLKNGLILMKDPLDIPGQVRDQLTTMQYILRPIPIDLTNEITQKMKITEAYYGQLIQAVRDASGNVTAVKERLNVEITKVQELYHYVQGTSEIGEIFEEFMKEDLKTLLKSVEDYMDRHSGGVKLVNVAEFVR